MMKTDSLKLAIEDSRARYVAANPRSMAADKSAEQFLPGGNTRSVLHYDPFPLTMVRGEGAELLDLDGHRYADFLCEYSAGLFGHSDKIIRAAVHEAIDRGVVMGAPTQYERELAGLLCTRFPSIEKLRFCNSGTESNLMAITTARIVTGREKIMVFDGAYHGGVIKFPNGNSRHNVPYDFVLSEYNDVEGTAELIHQLGSELAAVVVEPILGAGGNIPGTREFLEMLRQETREAGAILVFDEVKTARIGPEGIQGLMGVEPDLTTLGKFIGGGLPTGAFGGNAEFAVELGLDPKQWTIDRFLEDGGKANLRSMLAPYTPATAEPAEPTEIEQAARRLDAIVRELAAATHAVHVTQNHRKPVRTELRIPQVLRAAAGSQVTLSVRHPARRRVVMRRAPRNKNFECAVPIHISHRHARSEL